MLEIVLVSVLGWGVVGAALAPAIGQYCGLVVMLLLLFRERALLPEHFATPPSLASIMPLLRVCRAAPVLSNCQADTAQAGALHMW